MTRIHLNAQGFPIPTEGLPDGLIAEDITPVTLVLEDGQDFVKADFVGLGYTNFEVWVVGAAGGRGGSMGSGPKWRTSRVMEVMPEPYWTDYKVNSRDPSVPVDHKYAVTNPNPPYDQLLLTHDELVEFFNPTHQLEVVTYHDPQWFEGASFSGGGGGGGGLHKVSGLLADIPASVPVNVGIAGADGAHGQGVVNGAWDGWPWAGMFEPRPVALPGGFRPVYSYTWFTQIYEDRNQLGPQSGADGEASSFGAIAKASGGKGGGPAFTWVGATKQLAAVGGAGGSGGTLVAGGGGDGSIASDKNGKDGTWDGTIGKGGGGGRGGRVISAGPPINAVIATNGGQGSFSFGDTSVFGSRGFRSNFIDATRAYDPATGEVISSIPKPTSYQVVAGGGGGAKAPGKRWHGSKASGYSPNGTVIIKLFKV